MATRHVVGLWATLQVQGVGERARGCGSRYFCQFNDAVRKQYIQTFDFRGMQLVDALR